MRDIVHEKKNPPDEVSPACVAALLITKQEFGKQRAELREGRLGQLPG
jgi:hypothetical protein